MSCCDEAEIICIGKALAELDCIIYRYSTIKSTFSNAYTDMCQLKTTLDGLVPSNALGQTHKDNYLKILEDLRKYILHHTSTKTTLGNDTIPKCRTKVTYGSGFKKLCFDLEGLSSLYYVQKTDDCGNCLYFIDDPRITPYVSNTQIITATSYPVWCYTYTTITTANYTQIASLAGGITYDEVLNIRTLKKCAQILIDRKTMDSLGKYYFSFKEETCTLTLKDPNAPGNNIDPREQGVIDGIFSIADKLNYVTNGQGSLAVYNSKQVLQKMIDLLNEYDCELNNVKERLCTLG